jgi:peptidoglycan lytic transglycosylase G
MTEGRRGDAFADPDDPRAAAREQRRREREARRNEQRRQGREAEEAAAAAAPPPPPAPDRPGPPQTPDPPVPPPPAPGAPDPPAPPRTADESFWDEDPEPFEEEEQEPPRRAAPPRRPGPGALAALRRHPLRAVGALAALAVLWFLFALFQPFHGDGSGEVVVTIPKGASVSEVGDILDESGVVSSSTLFQFRVTIAGERSGLYPGRFVLARDMSYGAAIDALTTAPAKKVATVTIPEGYSRAQAAPLAEEAGLSGSYREASVRSRFLKPARYGGKGARNLEGFLFPDTFELKPGAPAADLVQLQLQDFKRRIKGVDMRYAKSKNLTVFDVVTIASMVEREAMIDSERPLVAAVIYNRLHEGMPLGIDATTRFATGNYDEPLTGSELATPSPYNTRTNSGLPPGPIDSPGLASIEAAARPAKVGYLFYVVKPGTCGEHSFSSKEAKFEADVARYEEARAAAGGESPDSCG